MGIESQAVNNRLGKTCYSCFFKGEVLNQSLVNFLYICTIKDSFRIAVNPYILFMRQPLFKITLLLLISVNIYGQKDSLSIAKSNIITITKNDKQFTDTLFIKQLDNTNYQTKKNYEVKVWLPTFTSLIVLFITNLVTLYKIRKDTSESIKKDIITSKIKIERERLEKFYDPIFTTLKSNASIFNAYGPNSFPRDSGVLETEASQVWQQVVENVIIPNNQKIENVIQQFSHLKNEKDNIDFYLEYLVHLESYRHFIKTPNPIHKAFRYPSHFINNVELNRNEIINRLQETEKKLLI